MTTIPNAIYKFNAIPVKIPMGIFFFFFFYRTRINKKEMATHSSVLAWRIPGTGEPCGLPSMGSHRVGHD